MSIQPGFEAAEQRRSFLQQTAENSSRYASSFVSYKTTGWGEHLSPDCQRFTTTFVRMPSVSHSFSLDGDKLVPGRFPRVTAGVHKWLIDSRGFYQGAWLFFVVETLGVQMQPTFSLAQSDGTSVGLVNVPVPIPADPMYDLIHSFTFTGIAMKDIPAHLLED